MHIEREFYESRMDKIFANQSTWKHRTLRTIFDPFSHEWTQTTPEEKVEIITTLELKGESLFKLIHDYKKRYKENQREDISNSVEQALIELLSYAVKKV